MHENKTIAFVAICVRDEFDFQLVFANGDATWVGSSWRARFVHV